MFFFWGGGGRAAAVTTLRGYFFPLLGGGARGRRYYCTVLPLLARIRYACMQHTLRIHTAYATHACRIRYACMPHNAHTLRMHTAYATHACGSAAAAPWALLANGSEAQSRLSRTRYACILMRC